VHIDLRDATFIDSTGLGALIEGYRAAGERQIPFVVLNPSASLRRVLAMTGLCDLFGLDDAGRMPGAQSFTRTRATAA
jgi:anti-sigma B factor antagonist